MGLQLPLMSLNDVDILKYTDVSQRIEKFIDGSKITISSGIN